MKQLKLSSLLFLLLGILLTGGNLSATDRYPDESGSTEPVWVHKNYSGGVACVSHISAQEYRIRFRTAELFREKLKPLKQMKEELPHCNDSCRCLAYKFRLHLLLSRENLKRAREFGFRQSESQAAPAGQPLK